METSDIMMLLCRVETNDKETDMKTRTDCEREAEHTRIEKMKSMDDSRLN